MLIKYAIKIFIVYVHFFINPQQTIFFIKSNSSNKNYRVQYSMNDWYNTTYVIKTLKFYSNVPQTIFSVMNKIRIKM